MSLVPVVVESPFAAHDGTPECAAANLAYARAALADCLRRGEAPFASHLLYTQTGVLDDAVPSERALGIEAGLVLGEALGCEVAVYTDRGITEGMAQGILRAWDRGVWVSLRQIAGATALTPAQIQAAGMEAFGTYLLTTGPHGRALEALMDHLQVGPADQGQDGVLGRRPW